MSIDSLGLEKVNECTTLQELESVSGCRSAFGLNGLFLRLVGRIERSDGMNIAHHATLESIEIQLKPRCAV